MSFQIIQADSLREKMNQQSDLFLVDVREEYEYEDFNIGGINIPMAEILNRTDELESATEIYLCCASGKRSKVVAHHLSQRLPDHKIFSLEGGVQSYKES